MNKAFNFSFYSFNYIIIIFIISNIFCNCKL